MTLTAVTAGGEPGPTTLATPVRAAGRGARTTRQRVLRGLALSFGLLLLLSTVRTITGSTELTTAGTAGAALVGAVPIGLAALGGLWSERAGVVNVGLEGMMILGTWSAAWVGSTHGPWPGVLAGAVGGALGGLVHAIATVGFGVDHVISGVAINVIAAGVARYLSATVYAGRSDAGPTQSPRVAGDISTVGLPYLSGQTIGGHSTADALGSIAAHRWFLVSDAAGLMRGVTGQVSLLAVVAVLLVPLTWLVLWRTAPGLRLRSAGESPVAAESLGVRVYRAKVTAVLVSGALAGLAGSFLVTVASSRYQENQTNGRGFIGLAAMIFGNWRPGGAAAGAGLFGYADGLQLRTGPSTVHALLLLLAVGLLAVALLSALALRGRTSRAALTRLITSLVAGLAVLAVFGFTRSVPDTLVQATPYVVTLLVLSLASQRLRPPAADGVPYRKGQAR